MLGLFAFWIILAVFSFLATWWLRGKLGTNTPAVKGPPPTGKLVKFHFGGKSIEFLINKELFVRLAFFILGPVAILSLSVSYAQLLPLRATFTLFVLPAYLTMIVLGFFFPQWGKRALLGFTAGVFATIIYDVVRWAIVLMFGLGDPIQHIALLLLGPGVDSTGSFWWVGYLWRFFGNGAGIGIAYAMLPRWFHSVKGGLVFGTMVGTGMLAVLFFFPTAQLHLFVLSTFVLITGFFGHWSYGATLGWIFKRAKPAQSLPDNSPPKEKPLTWSD